MPGLIFEGIQRSLTLPGGSIDRTSAYVQPLRATGGGLAIAAATANQALSIAVSGQFGYITDLVLLVTATAAVAGNIALLDASGGTVLWNLPFPGAPAAGAILTVKFSNPPRTAAAGGQFFITTTGAGVTWAASCNGYTDGAFGL